MAWDPEMYESVLRRVSDGVAVGDKDRIIRRWNPAAEQITGHKREEVENVLTCEEIFKGRGPDGRELCKTALCPLDEAQEATGSCEKGVYIQHASGYLVAVNLRTVTFADEQGDVTDWAMVFSESLAAGIESHDAGNYAAMALFDPVSGVGSRRQAEVALRARLDEMRRYQGDFGILLVHLDGLSHLASKHGVAAQDRALRLAGAELSKILRGSDVIARWTGHKFIAILPYALEPQLWIVGDRVRARMAQFSVTTEEGNIGLSVSIGGTPARPSDNMETLPARARKFVEEILSKGGNGVKIAE
ncbi:MAG: diguanylate cyclase [Deltaproteobacteria bacterium]|nr:diguanylate cyclase [Deltaproteobacteria bacterium]